MPKCEVKLRRARSGCLAGRKAEFMHIGISLPHVSLCLYDLGVNFTDTLKAAYFEWCYYELIVQLFGFVWEEKYKIGM